MGHGGNSKFLVLVLALLFVAPIIPGHAYVDWLKCFIDLDDEDEVIMHRSIAKVEDQSEEQKKVVIEVQAHSSSSKNDPWMATTTQYYGELFPSIDPELPSLLKVRLRLPHTNLSRSSSVQFVAEATGEGVSFVGRGVVCDGKRAFSKRHDEHVLLRIRTRQPSASDGAAAAAEEEEAAAEKGRDSSSIELVAAWAGGYEAVKLTQRLTIERSGPGAATNGSSRNSSNSSSSSSDHHIPQSEADTEL